MKIAHVIFSLNTGCIENELVDLINYQSEENHLIALFIINNIVDPMLLEHIKDAVHIVQIKRPEGSRRFAPIIKLNYLLSKWNAEIIHCHNQNIISAIVLKHLKKKAVITAYDYIEDLSIKQYRKFFTVSHSLEKMALKKLIYQPMIIYGGVDLSAIPFKINYREDDNTPIRILQLDTLNHSEYGQNLSIEALAYLHNKGIQNIWIDFIGDGESKKYLESLARNYQLENYISFLGKRNREYIYQNIKKYDLVIYPRQNDGFSLTILEAMAAKVPVLVSNIYSSMEIIGEGKYGFSFSSNNYFSLANTITKIFTMKASEIRNLTEEAYQYVGLNHDIKNIAKCYLQHYTEWTYNI